MAFNLADRVKEASTTTGTVSFALGGASIGFRTFNSILANGDTTWYCAVFGTEFEVGLGTFSAPSTLARTSILDSSNSGSAVSFSAGAKDVFITAPAAALEGLFNLVTILAGKAPLASPALTGVPTAPTATVGTDSDQLATMAAIKDAIDALMGAAPGQLDTLKEFADALANDPNFAATMTAALAGKLPNSHASSGDHDGRYYTETEIDALLAAKASAASAVLTGPTTVQGVRVDVVAKGSVSSGTTTFDVSASAVQTITNAGAHTWAFSSWGSEYGEVEIHCTNAGAFAITLPTINWLKGDGTKSTTFSTMGVTLQASGTNTFVIWTPDGGTTLYGRAG